MKSRVLWILLAILGIALIVLVIQLSTPPQPAIASCDDQGDRESKHFLYGRPDWNDGRDSDQLIERSLYEMSFNYDTKLADWVGYCLDKDRIDGNRDHSGYYGVDPDILPEHQLRDSEYECARGEFGAEKGHLAPSASFENHPDWEQVNYISNIAPQNAYLNQGIWKALEDEIRNTLSKRGILFVVTGPYYNDSDEESALTLPRAGTNKVHRIPSGFWKIAAVQDSKQQGSVEAVGFAFENFLPQKDGIEDSEYPWELESKKQILSIREIEKLTGLDFFPRLDEGTQNSLEKDKIAGSFLSFRNEEIDPPNLSFPKCQS